MDKKKIFLLSIFLILSSSSVLAGVSSFSYDSAKDGTYWNYGNTVDFSFTISATQGDIDVIREGVVVKQYTHPGSTYSYSISKTYSAEKNVSWYVSYQGDDGTTKNFALQDIFIRNDAYFATLSEISPNDGATISGDNVNFDGEISTQEPGTFELFADTCVASSELIGSTSVSSGNYGLTPTQSYNDCSGTYTWYLKYTGNDGSTKYSSGVYPSFTIKDDSAQASVTYNSPNDGANINGDINQEASITYDFDLTAPSGSVTLRQDGVDLNTWTHNGGSAINYDYTVTNSDGNYDWNVEYTGDDGSVKTFSIQSYEIQDYADRVSLSTSNPTDGESMSSQTVTFQYGGSGGGDGDVKLYVDGNLESTKSWTGSTSNSYSTTVDVGGGSHTYYVQYVGDDGSSTSTATKSFSTPTDASQLTEFQNTNPVDGATFTGTDTSVTLEVSIGGADGSVEFYVDGSKVATKTPGCTSCTTTVSYSSTFSDGTHDWYAKFVGSDGSTTTTSTDSFTVNSDASVTSLSLDNPSQGETINDAQGDVTFQVGKSGQDGTVELYIDSSGTTAKTWSLSCSSCSESLSYTTSLSSGSHSYNARYVGSDGSSFTTSTKDFSVQTTSDAQNTTLSPNYPKAGQVYNQETVEYNYSVNGSSGSVEIYRNGSKIHTDSYSGGGSQTFSYSENLSNGAYEYYLKYVGGDGSTKSSSTRSFSVDAPLTSSISLGSPADQKQFKNTFPIDVNYSFQVSGESGTIELYRDGNVIKTFTHPEGKSLDYSYTESFSQEGNHTYYVKYIRDSDSQTKTSLTRNFSIVQKETVSLSIQSPTDGSSFDYGETVKFDYSASSNVIGTVELLLNGSSVNSNNYASPGSTKYYSYNASSLSGDAYNARIRFTSDDGNTHFSNYVNFSVKDAPVTYIENIQFRYRGVDSGSVEKSIFVNLTGNSSIDSHGSVSGDTAVFNDEKWVIENVSIPYQDNLVVYDSQNRNDTRSLDLDVSVKNVAGHPENANLSYQEKNRTLSVQNNGATFDFNYSCSPNAYGNPANVDGIGQVIAGSSSNFACRWSGDWLNHSSGNFDPTVSSIEIDSLLPMRSWIKINNSASVSFPSVKYPEIVPDPTCSTAKPVSVGNNSEVNKTAEIECDIGDSGNPTLTIDGSQYKWNTTINLTSNLTKNITLTWSTNKSKLAEWSNKDPGSAFAYFKGVRDNILLAESSSSVKVIVPDGTFTGGVGEGLHPARIEYTLGASSGGGGGTGGSGGGSTPRIIKNVTGKYNWSVSAPRSRGQTFYNIVGWGGRDLGNAPTRIVVRNLGSNNFTVEARCVSKDDSCQFVELSRKNVTLNALGKSRQVIQVEGVIPQDIPSDGYRFNIVFEDSAGKTLEANFRIKKNFAQSLIIRFISKVFGVEEIDFDGEGGGRPIPVPLALPVFLITGIFWGAVALFVRFAQSNNMLEENMDFTRGRLIASVLVFILAFIFI